MLTFVYRNYTVEHLFDSKYTFSGYADVLPPNELFENYVIFFQIDPSHTPEEQIQQIEEVKEKISFIINSEIKGRIIIFNLYRESSKDWEVKNAHLAFAIDTFNQNFLKEISEKNRSVKILDINSFLQKYTTSYIEWRFFFTSQMIISPKIAKLFKEWFNKQLQAINLSRKKCIVLDCDNTLWGGVLGEDGIYGVKLGQDYPGNCFYSFQKLLLMLSRKGVILTVCSKNNLKDIQDFWEKNPNNLINDSVLSAYRINWQDKASNIKSIAEELNIGLDSLVFIDDNPLERGIVKQYLPEIEVPDFPEKPYDLIDFFWKLYFDYFLVYELSEEDLRKTEQYKEIFFRNESKKVFENKDDYLASLDIQIDVIKANDQNLHRISQMTQKTNQFNLTTKRYTEEQLRKLIEDGASIYCASVKDKFGDNGITIAGIITEDSTSLYLDSYLLSCRILGREIEKVVLLKFLELSNYQKNKPIKAQYIPTKKNIMTSEFLDSVGFVHIETDNNGIKKYSFDKNQTVDIKDYYTININ